MSYLYSTFAQLVSVHCKATAAKSTIPVNQCKRNLLTYGYEKLQTFSNEQLDAYDPYQRDASGLIWSSIMRDHSNSTLITTREPLPIPSATSIVILTHQTPLKLTPNNNDKPSTETSNTSSENYPQNPLFDSDVDNSHKHAMDMDIAYGYSGKPDYNLHQVEVFDQSQSEQHPDQYAENKKGPTYLTGGPSIVRVRTDGTPVHGDALSPTDDDRDALYVNRILVSQTMEGPSQIKNAASEHPIKHRKIATMSTLKTAFLSNLALQKQLQPPMLKPAQELQPPLERPRSRRHYSVIPLPLYRSA